MSDAENQRHQRSGDLMEIVLQGDQQDQAQHAGDQRGEMRFRQVDDDIVEALPEVATPAFDAQQLGQLFNHNDQRQAGDKTDHHRLGEELRHPPQF